MVSIGYIVAKELSVQAFGFTLGRLSTLLTDMSKYSTESAQSVHRQLTNLVPTAKLKIVDAIIRDFENVRSCSQTIDALLESMADTASLIHIEVHLINLRVQKFESWIGWLSLMGRLGIDDNLNKLRVLSSTLEDNFALLTQLLPSCIIAAANNNFSKKPTKPPQITKPEQ